MTEKELVPMSPVIEPSEEIVKPEQRQDRAYQLKLAGFWTRFWAYLIDLLVIASLGGMFIKPVFRVADITISNPMFLLFTPYKITMLIIALCYFAIMTKICGQTVGKMILGIKVVAQNETSLTVATIVFREVIGRFISKTLVLPYLFVVFMPKKEALHDIFADTVVVHENVFEQVSMHQDRMVYNREQLQESTTI